MQIANSTVPSWRFAAAIAAVVVVAYWNAFGLGTALDGTVILQSDPRIRALTWDNLQTIFTTGYWSGGEDRLYRPLTILSFLFNYAVLGNGEQPAGYHAINIALHLANALLVFGLARRLLGRQWPAFFAAAVWAVHPVGVEAVANIAGRSDLLATASLLAALLLYAGWNGDRPGRWRALAFFGFALAALFSKETGAMLIPLMLLWDAVSGRLSRSALRQRAPAYTIAAAVAAIYAYGRIRALDSVPFPVVPAADNPLLAAGFWQARWTAVRMLGSDLLLLLWPARLTCDRSFDEIRLAAFSDPGAWLSLIAILAIAAIVIRRRRAAPALAWASGFFLIALFPASNLVVLIGATTAERFLYLPSIGFCLALTIITYRLLGSRRPAPLALAAIGVALAGRTVVRNANWSSDLALAEHDSHVAQRSARIHENYGRALLLAGPARLDEATVELEKAWAIISPVPDDQNAARLPMTLASCYTAKAKSDVAGARLWNEKALALLERADRINRAEEKVFDRLQLQHGKPLPPRAPSVALYLQLGNAYRESGRYREALDAYRYGRGMSPDAPAIYDAASEAAGAMGDAGGAALLQLEKAVGAPQSAQSLQSLATWYARLPDGACAITTQGGIAMLNTTCPRILADLCRALPEVARLYADARQPGRAADFERMATQYGCRPTP